MDEGEEKALLCLRSYTPASDSEDMHCNSLQQLLKGNFMDVLKSEDVRRVMKFDAVDLWTSWDFDAITAHMSSSLGDCTEKERDALFVAGVSAVCLFAQANWTGPDGDWDDPAVPGSDEDRARCVRRLSVDGTEAYQLMRCPEALGIARVVFEGCQDRLSNRPSFRLWRIRYAWLHQQVLEDSSPHLFDMVAKDATLPDDTQTLISSSTQLTVDFYLTLANIYTYYHHVTEAAEYISKAQQALKLNIELVGALGRRTYFQTEARAQLALRLTEAGRAASPADSAEDCSEPAPAARLPPDLRLGDDTRRERVQYDDPQLEAAASPLTQALILTTFHQTLRAQGRSDIRDEQLLVMLSTVTRQPQIWAVQLSALLQRSRLESAERRTVERAMTQTQALVDAVSEPAPPPPDRLQLFFCTPVPTRWQVEAELAARYLAMGVTKAALEVYERLQLWEEAIKCYHLLQERQRAAEVVRRQISLSGETPKLLCLLGDATDDVTCYQRAWQLSGEKYVRAVRSEGFYYYNRKQYGRCLPLLRRSVEMNSLQFGVWSRLAFAALQTEDWKTCAAAYRRCCVLEPDNYEAWNNIAHAYIKLGQKERAWKTLQEALKFSFDNWKIWENFLVVSVDIGEFEEAVSAYGRLADVRKRHVDGEILRLLVAAVLQDRPDRHGAGAARLHSRLAALLGKLTAQVTSSGVLWSLYGDLSAAERSEEARYRAVQHYQKAHRCLSQQTAGAEKQPPLAAHLLDVSVKLSAAALDWAESTEPGVPVLQTLASVKLAVRGTITKVKAAQTDQSGDVREELRDRMTEAEAALQRVLDAIQSRQAS